MNNSFQSLQGPFSDTHENDVVILENNALVPIPENENNEKKFTFKKLWAFTGPGFLMSIAYLDPGNIQSDLTSGVLAKYKLLWILLLAHILGFFLQRLSARLGVVSGKHMAEMAHEYYPKIPRLVLWIMIEIAIVGSDMQEVIGTAIAFRLLSQGYIKLVYGVLITMLDTFTFLFIDQYGFRKLEFVFAVLICLMSVTFGYEFFVVKPDPVAIVKGMLIPWCSNCGQSEFMQGIGIVGAVIMPHNLYLHSALVKSRRINRNKKKAVTEANYYYFIESGFALLCSFLINLCVVSVFAHFFINQTIKSNCPITDANKTLNSTVVDLEKAGILLGCEFGMFSLIVWGIGVLAAGQSSTMTGTYAGQFVMEGFLKIEWSRWRRVFFTRVIAITPALILIFVGGTIEKFTKMNDLLNCVMMIQLPFALLPIITFTANKKIMFEYSTTRITQVFVLIVSLIVISINLYFTYDKIIDKLGKNWYTGLFLFVFGIFYVTFILYLVILCLQAMDVIKFVYINNIKWLCHNQDNITVQAAWQKYDTVNCQSTPYNSITNRNVLECNLNGSNYNYGYTDSINNDRQSIRKD